MGKYTFTKGELALDNKRLSGWVKASTNFQQMPSRLDIDTPIDRVGPFSINEVGQFRLVLTWSILFPILVVAFAFVSVIVTLFVTKVVWLAYLVGFASVGGAAKVSMIAGRKWFSVYMVQFSNNGQTVYVPYIKKTDYSVIEELNAELKKYR